MSFDRDTRNLLARTVTACRRRLTEDVTDQLRGVYALHPDGTVLPLEELTHLSPDQAAAASRLRDLLEHYTAGAAGEDQERRTAAYERMVLEISFTFLNRLAALRLCEERGLVVECVRRGTASDGFQLFERVSGGALGTRYEAYRAFLWCLFDELALDLGILFDRLTPQSSVFPTERCMEDVLAELNKPELTSLWSEDETIGWIYQYFNPLEERKAMREASKAPRNSRELAVRNQFFTPRYVVEFLTDNSLGRIWSEMRKGDTALQEECHFLIKRPNEVYLSPGETDPADIEGDPNFSQEEPLRKPVYIAHRPKKDPRDLRVIDPACGSGHFLLYAFDLLERIYEEAWQDAESPTSEASGCTLREDFETLQDLRRAAPKLIIEHNLYGIDIDSRAVQIAALALWLRAQKCWANLSLKPADRPRIDRTNIVTAEPMPGEEDLRREFSAELSPRVLGQLVDVAFDRMKLAGDAGSLLKIEEEITGAVAEARNQWLQDSKPQQQLLFQDMSDRRPRQQKVRFDLEGVTDERFWEQAEGRILETLREYAEQVDNRHAVRRRLFAEDAARGFAFIDLCRQRYDVALMNPPFGDASLPSKSYVEGTYGDSKGDVYKAFVECFHSRLVPAGYLGIISSRTGFFLGQSEDWRTRVVLRLFRPIALADLGSGVLDAMVEVAAYVLRNLSVLEARSLTLSLVSELEQVGRDRKDRFSLPKWQTVRDGLKRHQAIAELQHLEAHGFIQRSPGDLIRYTPLWQKVRNTSDSSAPPYPPLICIRALADANKGNALAEAVTNASDRRVFVTEPAAFTEIPSCSFAYWVSGRVRSLFQALPKAESNSRRFTKGLCTTDDWRFLRAHWEIDVSAYGTAGYQFEETKLWASFAKGGEAKRFYADTALVIKWAAGGAELKAFLDQKIGKEGQWSRWINSVGYYFRPGLTWPLRAAQFSPQVLPAGCIFSVRGYAAFAPVKELPWLLGLTGSSAFDFLFKTLLGRFGFPEFVVGALQQLPIPELSIRDAECLGSLAGNAWSEKRTLDSVVPTSHAFLLPALLATPGSTLAERADTWCARVVASEETVASIQTEIDDLAFRLYRLNSADRAALTATLVTASDDNNASEPDRGDEDLKSATVVAADIRELAADLLDYTLGAVFGRWDVRLALDETLAPGQPEPFGTLPVCPPGMLVGPNGLPAATGCLVSEEYLRDRPDANAQPPQGSNRQPAVLDDAYPIRVSWNGILVDDPGFSGEQPNRDDIVGRVREVLDLLWDNKAHDIEQEACEVLGVSDLRDYFRKPTGFFQHHLTQYSKSQRKAPIYWPLSTKSGSYTVWLYYHRLSDQTLFATVNTYIEPRITELKRARARIEEEFKAASGAEATRITDRHNEVRTLLGELQEMRDEILRIASLPYKPNLNDGVIINAAPFHNLFRLRTWTKDTGECWKKLQKGDYDWAHLANTIWPERVREVCTEDRSIAIAHGLEDLYMLTTQISSGSRRRRCRKKEAAE